jgi:recombinational DNA repair ATPase RecF
MYIKQLNIQNIRAISDLEITFEQPAGWHVLIGDNGQGKTSVLRAVVLAMLGNDAILAFKVNTKH